MPAAPANPPCAFHGGFTVRVAPGAMPANRQAVGRAVQQGGASFKKKTPAPYGAPAFFMVVLAAL
jgi:hypothetical protein